MKMTGAIRKQLGAFMEGFYDIIPKRLISIFTEQELELLISGQLCNHFLSQVLTISETVVTLKSTLIGTFYFEFNLYRIRVYSGFGIDRFHCTNKQPGKMLVTSKLFAIN
jgi:hypothetical protein